MKELVVIGAAVFGAVALKHLSGSAAAHASDSAATAGVPVSSAPTAAAADGAVIQTHAGPPLVVKAGELPTVTQVIGAPTKAVAGTAAPNPVAPILPGPTGYYQIAESIAAAKGTTTIPTGSGLTTPKQLNQALALIGPQIGAIW